MTEIIFLGSGGGRWTTITQRAKTGGFRIHAEKKVHVDPGPGAIVSLNSLGISPMNTDAVIVTHCHPDHYNDAEMMIEAMTHGATKKAGVFAGSESVLSGADALGPGISKYHQSKPAYVEVLRAGREISVDGFKVRILTTRHSDPTNVGLKFITEAGVITYTSDTEYFERISEQYSDSQVLILNVIRPRAERISWHLCSEDAERIIREVQPKLAILNHFGMRMIGVADKEAERIESTTGIKCIAAKDTMKLSISRSGFTTSILKEPIQKQRELV